MRIILFSATIIFTVRGSGNAVVAQYLVAEGSIRGR
jgi:hypothetical protein